VDDLIEALQIFNKYMKKQSGSPTHCVHDELWVYGVDTAAMTEQDKVRLDELGFTYVERKDGWRSYTFGSC
jgi:hypothetical protein